MEFRDSAQAFDEAIRTLRLSDDPKATNYAGHFMYMGTENGVDLFKHVYTRQYIPAQGPADESTPATCQAAVVCLQHIINRSEGQPDVIYACAVAIADIASEAALNGTIVDPLLGSDFEHPVEARSGQ